MVFSLNFCLAFIARERCSSKAIPEIILDFFLFFFLRLIGLRNQVMVPGKEEMNH